MPSKLSTHLKSVIDQFTPEILGAFWITDEELSRELLGFDEFNYLFDGLISQYLYGQSLDKNQELNRSNIFFTNNFNQKIFLAHIKNSSETAGVLDEQISLIQGNRGERKKILIFNLSSKNWLNELQKRYAQFEFQNFNIEK